MIDIVSRKLLRPLPCPLILVHTYRCIVDVGNNGQKHALALRCADFQISLAVSGAATKLNGNTLEFELVRMVSGGLDATDTSILYFESIKSMDSILVNACSSDGIDMIACS